MTAKAKTKTYPSHVLADACRAAGATVHLLWEVRGPRETAVAWMSCYQIGRSTCIVQTYSGNGWNAYTPCNSIGIEETIADVLNRCSVPYNGAKP